MALTVEDKKELKEIVHDLVEQYERNKFLKVEQEIRDLLVELRHQREIMDIRFGEMHKRFEELREDMNKRFEQVDKRFEDMNKRISQQTWFIGAGFILINGVVVLLKFFG
jgi:gas vesicle protein